MVQGFLYLEEGESEPNLTSFVMCAVAAWKWSSSESKPVGRSRLQVVCCSR
eukprot:EC835990.1.p5 GENE.EC835990.1~~EC835990.1.p5  ORF type:complete len:51 (-),score=0.70 EC835990.1:155-307(-)